MVFDGRRYISVSTVANVLVVLAPVLVLVLPVSSRELSLATLAIILASLSYSMDLSWGYGGLISLMPAALWGTGAFTTAYLVEEQGWNSWLTLPATIMLAGAIAFIVSVPALRARGFHFAILTFALAEFMRIIGNNWEAVTGGHLGLFLTSKPSSIGPVQFGSALDLGFIDLSRNESLYVFALLILWASILILVVFRNSKLGLVLSMNKQNEDLARSLGFATFRYFLAALALSGAMAGLSGHVYAFHQGVLTPDLFGIAVAIQVVMMILIGGSATISGPLIGATIVIFLPEFLNLSPNDSRLVYGGILVVFALAMPTGLVGLVSSIYGDVRSGAWREWGSKVLLRLEPINEAGRRLRPQASDGVDPE